MAGPGGWSKTGISFSDDNKLRFLRGDNGSFEESPFATLKLEDKVATIAASEHHQVLALESTGSLFVGFNAPEDFIKSISTNWRIPGSFLQKILGPGSLSRFDY